MKDSFFQVVSIGELIALLQGFGPTATRLRALETAHGMALAEDVRANEDLPLTNRSCVDGYALRAEDGFGASESNPAYVDLAFVVDIETPASAVLEPGQCAQITTGGCLPEGADSVIMVEHTARLGADTIELRKTLAPWDNVMLRGEDAADGQVVLPSGAGLNAARIGLLAALGIGQAPVHARVRVGIISSGDEVVDVEAPVRPGLVRDVNSHALAALARAAGARVVRYGLVKDDLEALTAMLRTGLAECDLLLVSGGSSVGTRDHTLEAMQRVSQGRILAHGIAMSPGKPTILASAGNKAVIGLPGQVASAQVVMQVLIMPFIAHLGGHEDAFAPKQPTWSAVLTRNVASRQGRTDFVRVALHRDEHGGLSATPVLGKSGLLKTMLQADGLMEIPENREGFAAGMQVAVRPLV